MPLNGLEHINIDTRFPEETVAFYSEVLGLENRPEDRPVPFPGAWLWLGDQAIVHLNFRDEWPDPDDDRPTGAFNHVAFEASGFEEMTERLDAMGLPYKTAAIDAIGLAQIFVRDPNGVLVELNLPGEAEAAHGHRVRA